MNEGKYNLEKAQEEAINLSKKVKSGEASNYAEAEKQLEKEGTSESQDLSPAERGALEKVIDFDAPENKNVVFHILDAQSRSSLTGGIFNVEQVLKQGLVSKDFSDRAGISRSEFGFNPRNPFQNGPWGISVFNMKAFKGKTNETGIGFEGSRRDLVLVIRPKKLVYAAGWSEHGEEVLMRRVKPRDIIGISVNECVLDLDAREFLSDVSSTWSSAKQLMRIAKNLHLEIPPELQKEIDNISEQPNKWEAEIKSMVGHMKELLKHYSRHSKEIKTLHYKMIEVQGWADNTGVKAAEKIKEVILPLIFEHEKFRNTHTVGDYLVQLGKQFKIPIYVGEKLYWPKKRLPHSDDSVKS